MIKIVTKVHEAKIVMDINIKDEGQVVPNISDDPKDFEQGDMIEVQKAIEYVNTFNARNKKIWLMGAKVGNEIKITQKYLETDESQDTDTIRV